MNIKLSQGQADFIRGNSGIISTWDKNIYFQTMVYTQNVNEEGGAIFEMKHISELPKEVLLDILSHIVTKSLNP